MLLKGPTRKQIKARLKRREAAVVKAVRAACVERDQSCRLAGFYVRCQGALQWCHMEGKRRHQTRGLPPEERHSLVWTVMLCARHADLEERHVVRMCYLTDEGANGAMEWRVA